MRLQFTVYGESKDYGESVEISNHRIDLLRRAAADAGIDPKELKSGEFQIQNQTDYVKNRHVHVGYRCIHEVGARLPMNLELLGNFIANVATANTECDVNLTFEVTDAEALKKDVLAAAVRNAKDRAETIATAAGLHLGSIQNIEYGYTSVRISSNSSRFSKVVASAAPSFEPDNIQAEDTVTITWEISG